MGASGDVGLANDRCWVGHEMNHFDLLDRREVYERIREWLDDDHRLIGVGSRPIGWTIESARLAAKLWSKCT